MSDWIRDPNTKGIMLNSEKFSDIMHKMMDKVKTLTNERDQAREELAKLKESLKFSTSVGHESHMFCGYEQEEDDLETDCVATDDKSLPGREKQKLKDVNLSLTDHSACCSRELSMKLVEQNQLFQKTITDILKLNKYSIDDYLKFTYNREKAMAMEREIKDLTEKLKRLSKEPSPLSLGVTDNFNEKISKIQCLKAENDTSGHRSNKEWKCKICLQNFDSDEEAWSKHSKKCKDLAGPE